MYMNKQEADIINSLLNNTFTNQRELAKDSGHSLGVINKSLKSLIQKGYLNENVEITEKAYQLIGDYAPRRAIILAAGYGMRMVPINTETPKGLLEVDGETLVERLINQLHAVGIDEIYIVVGFMKENYEYLIDEYGVQLVVNDEYALKNNLHSLKRVLNYLDNSYIIPCDIWCDQNPFSKYELYSWYMVSDLVDKDSNIRVNRKNELISIDEEMGGNTMIGISYLIKEQAEIVKKRVEELSINHKYDNSFWEEALLEKEKMILTAKVVHSSDVVEINTYEQLRELDEHSNQLKTEAIFIIMKCLNVTQEEIKDIVVLKKGMTNRSFLFTCKNKKYIMRIPGEGTGQLINREEETDVYCTIKDKKICDEIIYINANNGYKITEFIENARVCNPQNEQDLELCMDKLREFHSLKLSVQHSFDMFSLIEFYEGLWSGKKSVYRDYHITKENVMSLQTYIELHAEEKVLTHIDAVPDNFLILPNNDVRLIDWEYAGMQDPHVDIAMFCIYALYTREEIDRLIDIYFKKSCSRENRIKIYCYIAVCGLLWSNWCEYKKQLGVEFGEYSLKQYRYAKEYFRIVMDELEKGE